MNKNVGKKAPRFASPPWVEVEGTEVGEASKPCDHIVGLGEGSFVYLHGVVDEDGYLQQEEKRQVILNILLILLWFVQFSTERFLLSEQANQLLRMHYQLYNCAYILANKRIDFPTSKIKCLTVSA